MIKIKKENNADLEVSILRHATGEISTIYENGKKNGNLKVYFLGIKLWETKTDSDLKTKNIDNSMDNIKKGARII